MKFTSLVACLKALLVLCLICCFALTVAAENYYPSEIGNKWVLISTDGSEQLTYTLEESEDTDVEGLIVLKIISETIGTDTTSSDIYDITVGDDGSLLLHQSVTDQGALGIAEAIYEPPVTFFPADLPIGHTWQIITETTLDLVGAVTSTSTIKVVAIEEVQTPAGVFENCVKLEINQKDKTPFTVLRKTSYQWLAPDVGPVKFLNNQNIQFELNSYNIIEPKSETSLMEDISLSTDVNGDGMVNILNLVRVASYFGEPVSDENARVDVNNDGEINILDLVRISQDFGK